MNSRLFFLSLTLSLTNAPLYAETGTFQGDFAVEQQGRGSYQVEIKATLSDTVKPKIQASPIQLTNPDRPDWTSYQCEISIKIPGLLQTQAKLQNHTNPAKAQNISQLENETLILYVDRSPTDDCSHLDTSHLSVEKSQLSKVGFRFTALGLNVESWVVSTLDHSKFNLDRQPNGTYKISNLNLDQIFIQGLNKWYFFNPPRDSVGGSQPGYVEGPITLIRR